MTRPPAPDAGLRTLRAPAPPLPQAAPRDPGAGTDADPARPIASRRHDRAAVRRAVQARRRLEAGERRRARDVPRTRLLAVGAAAVLALLVGLPLLLAFGPAFPVRTIAVSGASAPLAAEVRDALRGELGRPVALVADRDVARALRAVPGVERFSVVRRPPSTLEVAVVPRTPVVQERTDAGWARLDAARVTVSTSAAPAGDLPVVAVPRGAVRPAQAFAAAVSAVQALRGSDAVPSAVRASSPDDVVLTLRDGRRVQWGGAEDGAAKAEALRAALVRAAKGVTEIDVSSPGVVLTR
ncbi:cell division protein FtsQ/DivIB [Amnibacterium setariae]|uniref:POTRA domain-containing protein n=1 Tax=Amnibacterium setariae TaxID=2306585 RepID=A0A3A1TYC2_9MICO|nr:FtsQ-type POTRA domain-containing protein [Amnibacterium setariae]RIX27665.1 hypothetical protein D1781_08870 [Amnibacterium setariae]